ncbi:MAG: hypothetical protein JXA43_02570 [Candidatus Diapherotrites archaeon]|nr:hypothetical protein [Candidatus Diapherotrites archaeon]
MEDELEIAVCKSLRRLSYISGDAMRESLFVRKKGDWLMFELEVMHSKRAAFEGIAMNSDNPEEAERFQSLSDSITFWFETNEPLIEEVKDKLFYSFSFADNS